MDLMDKVKKIIVKELGVVESKVTPDAHFVDDLKADSYDTDGLIRSLEKEFDISIPCEDADELKTVGEVVEYLKKHLISQDR